MPTEITQTDIEDRTELRVTGELQLEDALLLEKICGELLNGSDRKILVDLAEIDFLDSEAAPAIRRLEASENVVVLGLETFVQSAIDLAERTAT